MSEELFDVVDERDCVVEQLPRSVVHARQLLHRAVHIFVFNTAGELLIHLRSATKDEYPNCWTSSAAGHLSAGEDYEETAHRELMEEIGLAGQLELLHKFAACESTSWEHTSLYRMISDDEPTFDPGEVARGEYASISEIARRILAHPESFSPAFRTLFEWYVASMHNSTSR